MIPSVIFFSLLCILSIILIFLRHRKKYPISFLTSLAPELEDCKLSKFTRNRYFRHSSGRVDLKEHPEFHIFEDTKTSRRYLVEAWNREDTLLVVEGESNIVYFEFLWSEQNDRLLAIPCLRKVISIQRARSTNEFDELFVTWNNGRENSLISINAVIGVVKYESI